MTDFRALLNALVAEGVEFIIVGGAAATAHGSSRLTQDLDIVYRRSRPNIARDRAAGRPKDLETAAELELIRSEREKKKR